MLSLLFILWPIGNLGAAFIRWRRYKRLHPQANLSFEFLDWAAIVTGAIPIIAGVIYYWDLYGGSSVWQCALLYLPAMLYVKVAAAAPENLKALRRFARLRKRLGITWRLRFRSKQSKVIRAMLQGIFLGSFIFFFWRSLNYFYPISSIPLMMWFMPFKIIVPWTLPLALLYMLLGRKWIRLKAANRKWRLQYRITDIWAAQVGLLPSIVIAAKNLPENTEIVFIIILAQIIGILNGKLTYDLKNQKRPHAAVMSFLFIVLGAIIGLSSAMMPLIYLWLKGKGMEHLLFSFP